MEVKERIPKILFDSQNFFTIVRVSVSRNWINISPSKNIFASPQSNDALPPWHRVEDNEEDQSCSNPSMNWATGTPRYISGCGRSDWAHGEYCKYGFESSGKCVIQGVSG